MVTWTTRKTNKYVLREIKAETSLEANMTKLKLSDFKHIIKRRGFWWGEKTIILGKVQGSKDRERPNMR